jgi:cytochrome c oxidase subunit 3
MSTALYPPPPAPPVVPAATGFGGPDASSHVAETGVWIGIGAISMTFAALTSALVVRASDAPDWHHLHLPALLYLNTLVLLGSSLTLEIGRRQPGRASLGLSLTTILGGVFVMGQIVAWRQLMTQQIGGGGPSSAFFYVLTALHAAHVLGGMSGLVYVRHRMRAGVVSFVPYTAAALYWHFMAVLWLYLLTLLTVRG